MAETTKKDLENWKEELKRHNDVLYEKFRSDVETITEGLATKQDLKKLATKENLKRVEERVDSTFEMVGKNTEDITELKEMTGKNTENITIIKEDIDVMKTDISGIKKDLKQKINKEEFDLFGKRVVILESKAKQA